MRGRRPRKLTDPKDIEEHWRGAFPEMEKPTYSPKAVQAGALIVGALFGVITFFFLLDFVENRYGEVYWGGSRYGDSRADGRIPIGYVFLASFPGVLLGMLIGAFLGAKLGPKE